MRTRSWVLVLVLTLLFTSSAQTEQPLQVIVDGNAKVFDYDQASKKLRLADCQVILIASSHEGWSSGPNRFVTNPSAWDVSLEYRNAESAQALFDEMLEAEPIKGVAVPHMNAGLTISATPPGDTSRLANIELIPAISMNGEPCGDVVSVSMLVYQVDRGKTFHNFNLRSSKLWDIVVAMSASACSLSDAVDATVAMMCLDPFPLFLEPDTTYMKTEDPEAVRLIVDTLLKAKPTGETNMDFCDTQQLLLWLKDGRRMNVHIGNGYYWDERDEASQRYRKYIRVGEQRYEVDVTALQDALREAGLEPLEMPD